MELILICLLSQAPMLDEQPQPLPMLWMPASEIPRKMGTTTYRIPLASLERAKHEAALVRLLLDNLDKEEKGIIDMDLRRKIRRAEVEIEAAQ